MNGKLIIGCLFAMCVTAGAPDAQAQSVKSLLQSVVGHFKSTDFTGTWNYEGVDVKFQSDNLLKKAGGSVAATKIENDLDEQLKKIGFEPGVTTFIFNEDSTFTNTTKGRQLTGTYSYDESTEYLTLKYMKYIPVKAKVSGSGNKISLLFEANSLMSLVTFLGSNSGLSLLQGASSLLKTYDGMLVGMELRKEK